MGSCSYYGNFAAFPLAELVIWDVAVAQVMQFLTGKMEMNIRHTHGETLVLVLRCVAVMIAHGRSDRVIGEVTYDVSSGAGSHSLLSRTQNRIEEVVLSLDFGRQQRTETRLHGPRD